MAVVKVAVEPEITLPRLRIGIISEVWHCWMTPVMNLRGNISTCNLPKLPPEDSAPELLARFEELWARHQKRKTVTGTGQVLQATCLHLLFPRFQLAGLWNVVDAIANFSQPFIVSALVRDLRLAIFDDIALDYAYAALLTITVFIAAASIQQVLWLGGRVGLRCKIALSAAVYTKSLRLGNAALLRTSAGEATNLVAIDCNRLEMSFSFFHMLWLAPANLVILGLILGTRLVGLACVPALAFLVLLFVIQKLVGGRIARMRSVIAKRTDLRVKCMYDVLAGAENTLWSQSAQRSVPAHTACLPGYLPAGLLACRAACLPGYLPAGLLACRAACLPGCLPAGLLACQAACLPGCLPAGLLACRAACLLPCPLLLLTSSASSLPPAPSLSIPLNPSLSTPCSAYALQVPRPSRATPGKLPSPDA